MNRRWTIALILLAIYAGWSQWQKRAIRVSTPDMIAPHEPVQENLGSRHAPSFQLKDYSIQAQARYRIEARLLSREPYRFGREADLSPVDFALGWGPMSANSLLEQMSITQSGRFYRLRWDSLTVRPAVVMQHSANTHIIPADRSVARQIDKMRPGQVVSLSGYLVNVTAPDGWRWNSSLTRNDTGAGACELFWVELAQVIGP